MRVKAVHIRLLVLLGLTIILILIGRYTSVSEWFEPQQIQEEIKNSGPLGVVIFIALYTLGTFLNIPGVIFMVIPLIIYGFIKGGILAYVGSIISAALHFLMVRSIGGKPLDSIKQPRIRKIMQKLEDHPMRTVFWLRLIMWISPPVNYALALSGLRFQPFLVGTVFGLIIPIIFFSGMVYFWYDLVLSWVGLK